MTASSRPTLLFMAEAVTLAHLARPLVLMQALDGNRFDLHLACDRRYEALLRGAPATVHDLRSIPGQVFLDRLAAGQPLYNTAELTGYIEQDLALIDQVKPALIVGDFRLSLAVSAALRQTPYANLTNAHWSPYATRRWWPLPEHAIGRLLGVGLGRLAFNLARPMVFALHATTMNRLRRKHGLPALGSLTSVYTHGDHTLYADVPSLAPTSQAPASHEYLGPILWSPPGTLPEWWHEADGPHRPIYVTLGSSGQVSLLPAVLASLADYPGRVMVATAGRGELPAPPANARVAAYLPGIEAAGRSAVMVCNGGSAPVYQALSQGTPVVGIASNLDQYLTMCGVVEAGAGVLLRAGKASGRSVREAVDAVIRESSYRDAAGRMAREFAAFNAGERFRAFVDRVTARR